VHDFLMYEEYEYDEFEYTICDQDGQVTTYVLNETYCHLLKLLHKWLTQLVMENSPSILHNLGHRKFSSDSSSLHHFCQDPPLWDGE